MGGVGDVSHVCDPFFCGVVLSVKFWQDSRRSVFLSKLWGFYDVVGVLCCLGAQGPAPWNPIHHLQPKSPPLHMHVAKCCCMSELLASSSWERHCHWCCGSQGLSPRGGVVLCMFALLVSSSSGGLALRFRLCVGTKSFGPRVRRSPGSRLARCLVGVMITRWLMEWHKKPNKLNWQWEK